MAGHHDDRGDVRLVIRRYATLGSGDEKAEAHLLNISGSGALVGILKPHGLEVGEPVSLIIELEGRANLELTGHVAHVKAHLVGLDCTPATDADMALAQSLLGERD